MTSGTPSNAFARALLAVTAHAIVIVTVVGCVPSPTGAVGDRTAADTVSVDTVPVQRSAISSVVTTPVVAVAAPAFTVAAPTTGKLALRKNLQVGSYVKKGGLIGSVGGKKVRAPQAGWISELPVPAGSRVARGLPVVAIQYRGFGAAGILDVSQAYRLHAEPKSAKVQFLAGPGLTDCTPVTPKLEAKAADAAQRVKQAELEVLCLLPALDGLVATLPGTLGLTIGRVDDALTIPLGSVIGSAGVGIVTRVLADGSTEQVQVELGISDGSRIEVVSGLSEGDILAASPLTMALRVQQ